MRSTLLSFVALAAFAAGPAMAQTVHPGPGKVVTGPTDLPSVEPMSRHASNITDADTRSPIAPALPSANVPDNASATDYLQAARGALAAGQTGRAQSALENAETLLLTRSVDPGNTGTPDANPAVRNIQSALHALAENDVAGAQNLVQQTIPMTQQAEMPAAMPPTAAPPNAMAPGVMAPGAMPPGAPPPNAPPPRG